MSLPPRQAAPTKAHRQRRQQRRRGRGCLLLKKATDAKLRFSKWTPRPSTKRSRISCPGCCSVFGVYSVFGFSTLYYLCSKVCAQTLGQIIKDHGAALGTVIADRVDILAGKSTTEMQVLSNQIKQYRSAIKDENQQDKLDLRQLLHQLKTVSDSLSVSATNLSNLELDLKKLVRATTAAMEAVAPVFPTGSAQVSDLTTTAMAEETTSAGQPSANLGKQKLVMTPGKTLGIAAHILAQSKCWFTNFGSYILYFVSSV